MIWDSSQISQEAKSQAGKIKEKILTPDQIIFNNKEHHVAIIGGGLFAINSLIRLLSELTLMPELEDVHIHWFDKQGNFGSGQTFNIDLPAYLLVNDQIGHLDGVLEWINLHNLSNQLANELDNISLELFGYYLKDRVFQQLNSLPSRIKISLIQSEITDLDIHAGFGYLSTIDLKMPFPYYSVLITFDQHSNSSLTNFSKEESKSIFSTSIDSVTELNRIPCKASIGIKGLGVELIYAVLQLTEGRGGIFYKHDGETHYIPTGLEPKIFPFSKNNLPAMPRNHYGKGINYELKFFTNDWISSLFDLNRQLDFEQDVLPQYMKEVEFAFYSKLPHLNQASLLEVLEFIEKQDPTTKFSIYALIDPFTYSKVSKQGSYHEFIGDLYIFCLNAFEEGNLKTPLETALEAFRLGFFQIAKLYALPGFTSESQQRMDEFWAAHFKLLSLGPIKEYAEKFFCLFKQGYIEFLFTEEPFINYSEAGFIISSGETKQMVNYLVDCELEKFDISRDPSTLLNNLYRKGILSEFKNAHYITGKIAIESNGQVAAVKDKFPLFFFGNLTAGATMLSNNIQMAYTCNNQYWVEKTIESIYKMVNFYSIQNQKKA